MYMIAGLMVLGCLGQHWFYPLVWCRVINVLSTLLLIATLPAPISTLGQPDEAYTLLAAAAIGELLGHALEAGWRIAFAEQRRLHEYNLHLVRSLVAISRPRTHPPHYHPRCC